MPPTPTGVGDGWDTSNSRDANASSKTMVRSLWSGGYGEGVNAVKRRVSQGRRLGSSPYHADANRCMLAASRCPEDSLEELGGSPSAWKSRGLKKSIRPTTLSLGRGMRPHCLSPAIKKTPRYAKKPCDEAIGMPRVRASVARPGRAARENAALPDVPKATRCLRFRIKNRRRS